MDINGSKNPNWRGGVSVNRDKYRGRYKEYFRLYHLQHKKDLKYKKRRYKTARKYILCHQDKVKQYHKEYSHKWYLEHKDNPEYKKKKNENNKKYSKRHWDRISAKNKVHNKLRFGKIERLPCKFCGKTPTEMHHPNYNKPLLVVHLCRSCHIKLHRVR